MRIERDVQLANAARLAGLLPPASAAPALAERIVTGVTPAITTLLEAELERLRFSAAATDRHERDLMVACKALGAAVDRLEQAMHTREEIPARRALILAAKKLRTVMRRRDHHATR